MVNYTSHYIKITLHLYLGILREKTMPLFYLLVWIIISTSRIYPPALLVKILPLDKYISASDSATLPSHTAVTPRRKKVSASLLRMKVPLRCDLRSRITWEDEVEANGCGLGLKLYPHSAGSLSLSPSRQGSSFYKSLTHESFS